MPLHDNELLSDVGFELNEIACTFMEVMGRKGIQSIVVTARAALAMGLPVEVNTCTKSLIHTACGEVAIVAQPLCNED